MARQNAKRDQLVNEVLRKHRNADKKVSRLEGKSVRIRNTDENPHRTPNEIRNMTTAELRKHGRELDRFTSRTNQYERGRDNTPIRRESWQQYLTLQERNNARAQAIEERLRNVRLPGEDTTIGTLLAQRETLPQGMNAPERIFHRINRSVAGVEGQRGMEELLAGMREQSSPQYINDLIERRMNSIRAALTYSGNADLLEQVNALSPSEQVALIDYGRFGYVAALNINSPKYSSDGSIREDYNEEEYDGTETQNSEEIHAALTEILSEVKNIGRAVRRGSRLPRQ